MIRKTTWIIVLIFLVLLAAVLLWQRSQDQKAAEATPGSTEVTSADQYLFNNVEGEVASLRIERVGVKAVELLKDQTGQWVLAGTPASTLDSAGMDSVLGGLEALPVVSTLQNPPQLETLGLEPPVYRLLITLTNGNQLIASVGKVTPTGSGYYVLSGDRRILIVNEYSLQSVLDLVDNPPFPSPPDPTSAEQHPGNEQVAPSGSSTP